MTITAPTKAELAAEVAQLRYELDALRDELFQMSTEVRTHRLVIDDHEGKELAVVDGDQVLTRQLVVVDENGVPRVSTMIERHRTMLTVGVDDVDNELGGHGLPIDATVYIEAEIDVAGFHADGPGAIAQVQCTTGDDSFAILKQRSLIGDRRGQRTVTDRGEVLLHQQQWEACYQDDAMNCGSLAIVEVGPDGVVERDVAGDLIAHAPMQRSVR